MDLNQIQQLLVTPETRATIEPLGYLAGLAMAVLPRLSGWVGLLITSRTF